MFAIIKTSGKQFKVSQDQELDIDFKDADIGSTFEIHDVLMFGGDNIVINPKKAIVKCEVLQHFRGPKLVVFKNRPRSTFRKKTGHRQDYTRIKIKEISVTN